MLATVSCAATIFPLDGIGDGTGGDASLVDAIGSNEAVDAAPDAPAEGAYAFSGADETTDAGGAAPTRAGASDANANPEEGTIDGAGDVDANPEEATGGGAGDAKPNPEGAAGDAASDADAAAGAPDADSGGSPFCASLSPQPRFCDDFDEHPLPGLWTTFNQVGGTLALDSAAFVSPRNSLLAQFPALQTGQPLDTALRTRFSLPAPPTAIVWDFQVQPVVVDTTIGAATVVAALDFIDVSNNRYSVQFALTQQGASLGVRFEEQSGFVDGGSSYSAHSLPDPMSVGVWTHVQVVVSRTAPTTASARVSFGAVAELNASLAMTVNGASLQMAMGSSFETEPSQGWKIRYDDVTLNF